MVSTAESRRPSEIHFLAAADGLLIEKTAHCVGVRGTPQSDKLSSMSKVRAREETEREREREVS